MPHGKDLRQRFAIGLCLVLSWLTGCSAFHPIQGVPARYLPEDMKAGRREGKRTIDLSLLSQERPVAHLIDAGDVLGIYIGGVTGKIDENPPVQIPQNAEYQPAAGIPVTVREDGTISLPMVGALNLRGKTTRQAEETILHAYTDSAGGKELLREGRQRILVSLQRPRQTTVLVIRQDSRNEPMSNAFAGQLNIGTVKRGSGKLVSLPAYRNDILNALVATDGIPGLDAENAVYVIRRRTNRFGQDPLWSGEANPEDVIRNSDAVKKTVIRGQSSDGWDYQSRSSSVGANPFSDLGSDYRQPGNQNPTQSSNQFGRSGFSGNRLPQGSDLEQSSLRSQNGMNQTQFGSNAPQGAFGQSGIDPTSYQNAQPWNLSNGTQSLWNRDNTQPTQGYSIAPTPINSPQQPLTPTPMPAMQPQSGFPNAAGQPNWPNQPAQVYPQNGGSMLPGQGHSLPDAIPDQFGQGNILGDPGLSDPQSVFDPNDISLTEGRRIIRIPIRLGPDEHVEIRREDVILHDGDIVFIESRDSEVFFTGGLLGGGQYTLPRDFDLNILQAISIAGSRLGAAGGGRQIGGVSALNSDVTISPSVVVVIRKLPEGGEVPIKIDILKARTDPSERLIIQPGDYIYLQYTPLEAVAAFIDRHLLEGAIFGLLTANSKL